MEVKQQYFSIKEAAIILGLSPSTLTNWVYNDKKVNIVRIGGAVRISKEEIDRLVVPVNKKV